MNLLRDIFQILHVRPKTGSKYSYFRILAGEPYFCIVRYILLLHVDLQFLCLVARSTKGKERYGTNGPLKSFFPGSHTNYLKKNDLN